MLTKEEKLALAERCWRSPVEFCRVFLPDWFPNKMPWVHRGILAIITGQTDFLLDFGPEQWADGEFEWTVADLEKIMTNFVVSSKPGDRDAPLVPIFHYDGEKLVLHRSDRIAIVMPRGFSKTTLINASNIRDIVYKVHDFFLYVSESGPHAERQLGSVKIQLESNALLKEVFSFEHPGKQDSEKWTENFIETKRREVTVAATGRGGQVRGFGKDAKRPKRIIADDLEDKESVSSAAQLNKAMDWFKGTLEPALHEDARGRGELIVIGTLLKGDALLPSLNNDEEWTWLRFGAVDRQGEALWEYKLSLEGLEKKKRSFAAVGQLQAFYLEYMSEVRNDEARIFPASKMIYVHKGKELFQALSLAMDPAISEKKEADFSAYAVAGMEATGHTHFLETYLQKGMHPNEQIDKFFELHFKWLADFAPSQQRHGIESIAYQRALAMLVRAKQFEYSKRFGNKAFFEVIEIKHGKQGKVERVQGVMQPRYWAGYISFENRDPVLENQFLEWPNDKLDGPDVCAMAQVLLDPMAQLHAGPDAEFNLGFLQDQNNVINVDFRHAP